MAQLILTPQIVSVQIYATLRLRFRGIWDRVDLYGARFGCQIRSQARFDYEVRDVAEKVRGVRWTGLKSCESSAWSGRSI